MNTTLAMELVQRAAPVSDEAIASLDLEDAFGELVTQIAAEPRPARVNDRLQFAPSPRAVRMRAAITGLAVAAAIGAFAVTPVGAALRDLGSTLIDYFDGANPPGRPLDIDELAPAWLRGDDQTGQRVIASAGPYSLYLSIDDSGTYNFGLDGSVALGDTRAGWEQRFAENSVVILGPGAPNKAGNRPLYGVTSGAVDRVELRYADGSTVTAPASTGGFVLLFDPDRRPEHLIARAADGTVLQTVPAHRYGTTDPPPGGRHHGPRHVPPNAIYLD